MKSSENKHLRMRIFYQSKDGRSTDQNKDEFHFISPATKTKNYNVSRFFFTAKRNFISGLM